MLLGSGTAVGNDIMGKTPYHIAREQLVFGNILTGKHCYGLAASMGEPPIPIT